ncbi:MAG TPA: hypothetical protein VJV78_06315 [Polyangiales bacterium]|nr:hypothetical protein [Polyangiales bacterium]
MECVPAKSELDFSQIRPTQPVDYVGLRFASGGTMLAMSDLQASGTACSGARDQAACMSKFRELLDQPLVDFPSDNCGQSGCLYAFTTAGDEVHRYGKTREIREFLGPIDTAADARFLFEWDHFQLCGDSGIEPTADGFEAAVLRTWGGCPVMSERWELQIHTDGEFFVTSKEPLPGKGVCIGRRPEGYVATRTNLGRRALGRHFARNAELEAASVAAFEVIARELEHYGAPRELIAAARLAAADEVRHARATARLARRFGGVPRAPRIRSLPVRSLEIFALDNATEGCVRETFGALVGHHQAAMARDAEITDVMSGIAEDETRHAALSHRMARWADQQLTAAQRARVAEARAAATITLLRELAADEPESELRELAGLPDAATSTKLLCYSAAAGCARV